MSQLSPEMLSAWSWKDSEVATANRNSENPPGYAQHSDFLSFLAVVQELGLDILPITWNDGLNSIGFGGTAVLREVMVDLKTSFALKHVVGRGNEERAKSFRALINEVTVLGQPSFQEHKNIVTLEGICWHTPTGEERVEPALVFEKAEHKDLFAFLTAYPGSKLNFSERLHLCKDIARGLYHGYQHGVCHGDIKPQNVLVFGSNGKYTAKVADYGYSSLTWSGDVAVAISRPWEAPELIDCNCSPLLNFTAAKRAEAYSFGLLCLWLLFNQHQIENSEMIIGNLFTSEGVHTLQRLKEKGGILDLALSALASAREISVPSKDQLRNAFQSLLQVDPLQRTSKLEDFLLPLESNSDRIYESILSEERLIKPIKSHFQVVKSLAALIESHLIVRKYVVHCLLEQEQYKSTNCSVCKTNASLQLWYCYNLGFGNPTKGSMNEEEWALHNSSSNHELESVLRTVRNTAGKLFRYKSRLQKFEDHGFLGALEYSEEHVKTAIQEILDREYPMEIEKMTESLGRNHILIYTLRSQYNAVLYRQGAYRDAFPLANSLYKDLQRDFAYGPEHVITQRATLLLSSLHWVLGEYKEAAELERNVMKIWEKTQGKENLGYIHLQRSHATTLRDQGDYKEAAAVEEQLLKAANALLGEKHQSTVSIKANLAVTYSNDGRYSDAEKLELEVLEAEREVLGSRHPDTLMAMGNLAFTYRDLGRWEDAEHLEKLVWRDMQDTLGSEHPSTLRAMINLANTWMNQGHFANDDDQRQRDRKFSDAQELIMLVVDSSKKVLGADHPDSLMAISSLSHCYRNTGKLILAKDLDQRLINTKILTLGETHPSTLKSIFNYALTLRGMGDFEAAKNQAKSCVEGRKDVLGPDHPLTLDAQVFLDSLLQAISLLGSR